MNPCEAFAQSIAKINGQRRSRQLDRVEELAAKSLHLT